MEKNVAQLFTDILGVVIFNSLGEFKYFFNGEGAETFPSLLAIPWALLTEASQNGEKFA